MWQAIACVNGSDSVWLSAETPGICMYFIILRGWEVIRAVTCNVGYIRESAFEATLVSCECASFFICQCRAM